MADSFFVENIFEELDADNEFFYDESTSTLYYYSSSGAPVGEVEMTLHKTFLSIVGTQEAPVRDVRLLGIGMRDTAISYLDAHSMPSGGDWGLGRIASVFIRGAVGTVRSSYNIYGIHTCMHACICCMNLLQSHVTYMFYRAGNRQLRLCDLGRQRDHDQW